MWYWSFSPPLHPPCSKTKSNTHRSIEQNDDRQWRRNRSLMKKSRRKTGGEAAGRQAGRAEKNAETEMNIMENLREIFCEMFSMHDNDERWRRWIRFHFSHISNDERGDRIRYMDETINVESHNYTNFDMKQFACRYSIKRWRQRSSSRNNNN